MCSGFRNGWGGVIRSDIRSGLPGTSDGDPASGWNNSRHVADETARAQLDTITAKPASCSCGRADRDWRRRTRSRVASRDCNRRRRGSIIAVPETIDKRHLRHGKTSGFDTRSKTIARMPSTRLHTHSGVAQHVCWSSELMGRQAGWIALAAGVRRCGSGAVA